ncbi:MAG: protein kinase [Victivallales bacterium]|nr:protein kinase [Victivallales bacterium]
MSNSMILSPGDKFEKYIIEKELGHGGMGAVYLVRHSILDTVFALKVLYPEVAGRDKQFVERFIREGRLAGQIRHENLIAVYDAGQNEKNGMYYLVMDFVSGGSVRDRIKKSGYVDMLEAISIVRQVACALQAAQNHNMVHRDIKPDNIMFDDKGVVRLADLGIAKATDDRDTGLTMESSVFGTPAYMSPEQARDSSKVDTRADIYSLGVVFYEMLTGRRPFSGDTTIEILTKVIDNTPAPDVRTFSKDLPADVAKLVADMLEKDREKRVKSPTELIKRIDALDLSAYQPGAQNRADEVEVTMPTMASPVSVQAPDVTMPTMATPVGAQNAPSGSAEPPRTDVTMPTMASPVATSVKENAMVSSAAPVPKLELKKKTSGTSPQAVSSAPEAPQETMAMPTPQSGGATGKPVKSGFVLILALVGVFAFLFIGGVGTLLFLKRNAIMAKFGKTQLTQTNEPEPITVSGMLQSPEINPDTTNPGSVSPQTKEVTEPEVKTVDTSKTSTETVSVEHGSVSPKPAEVKPATSAKQETVEFGLTEQTEQTNISNTANAEASAANPQNVSVWRRFTNGAQQFGKQVAKDTREFGQQVAHQVTGINQQMQSSQPDAQQHTQQNEQKTTQPNEPPVQPPVVQEQGNAGGTQNGLQKLGSFEEGGVVLFGANDVRNTSFFRELSKTDAFKAVGFQEASKDVKKWNSQLSEIQSYGPAFVIVVLSEEKNDYNFKKMLQGLVKVLPSSNGMVLVASGNPAVFDEVKDTCNTVGMYFRKWAPNKELANYVLELKRELGW